MARAIEMKAEPITLREKPPEYMSSTYDWVEDETRGRWLPNALHGRVIGHMLSRIPADSPLEHILNVVRRAYHAHSAHIEESKKAEE